MTVDAAAIYERIDAACCTYHGFKLEAERGFGTGAREAEGTGVLTRQIANDLVGSNPTLSVELVA